MATGTIRLHRILRCEPNRVYQAFLDPRALAKWLPPHGFVCEVHQLEACYLGWQESLGLLAQLVEAEIPA